MGYFFNYAEIEKKNAELLPDIQNIEELLGVSSLRGAERKASVDAVLQNIVFANLLTLFDNNLELVGLEGLHIGHIEQLQNTRLAYLDRTALEEKLSALAEFSALAQNQTETAKESYAQFASDILLEAAALHREKRLTDNDVEAIVRLLALSRPTLADRDKNGVEEALRSLLEAYESGRVEDYRFEQSLNQDRDERGKASAVHVLELPSDVPDNIEALALDIARRITRGENIVFIARDVSQIDGMREILGQIESFVDRHLDHLAYYQQEDAYQNWKGLAERVIDARKEGLLDESGRFDTPAIYEKLPETFANLGEKYRMSVGVLKMTNWNRNVPGDLMSLVKFIVELAGKPVQVLPLLEEQLKAIEFLAIQA